MANFPSVSRSGSRPHAVNPQPTGSAPLSEEDGRKQLSDFRKSLFIGDPESVRERGDLDAWNYLCGHLSIEPWAACETFAGMGQTALVLQLGRDFSDSIPVQIRTDLSVGDKPVYELFDENGIRYSLVVFDPQHFPPRHACMTSAHKLDLAGRRPFAIHRPWWDGVQRVAPNLRALSLTINADGKSGESDLSVLEGSSVTTVEIGPIQGTEGQIATVLASKSLQYIKLNLMACRDKHRFVERLLSEPPGTTSKLIEIHGLSPQSAAAIVSRINQPFAKVVLLIGDCTTALRQEWDVTKADFDTRGLVDRVTDIEVHFHAGSNPAFWPEVQSEIDEARRQGNWHRSKMVPEWKQLVVDQLIQATLGGTVNGTGASASMGSLEARDFANLARVTPASAQAAGRLTRNRMIEQYERRVLRGGEDAVAVLKEFAAVLNVDVDTVDYPPKGALPSWLLYNSPFEIDEIVGPENFDDLVARLTNSHTEHLSLDIVSLGMEQMTQLLEVIATLSLVTVEIRPPHALSDEQLRLLSTPKAVKVQLGDETIMCNDEQGARRSDEWVRVRLAAANRKLTPHGMTPSRKPAPEWSDGSKDAPPDV